MQDGDAVEHQLVLIGLRWLTGEGQEDCAGRALCCGPDLRGRLGWQEAGAQAGRSGRCNQHALAICQCGKARAFQVDGLGQSLGNQIQGGDLYAHASQHQRTADRHREAVAAAQHHTPGIPCNRCAIELYLQRGCHALVDHRGGGRDRQGRHRQGSGAGLDKRQHATLGAAVVAGKCQSLVVVDGIGQGLHQIDQAVERAAMQGHRHWQGGAAQGQRPGVAQARGRIELQVIGLHRDAIRMGHHTAARAELGGGFKGARAALDDVQAVAHDQCREVSLERGIGVNPVSKALRLRLGRGNRRAGAAVSIHRQRPLLGGICALEAQARGAERSDVGATEVTHGKAATGWVKNQNLAAIDTGGQAVCAIYQRCQTLCHLSHGAGFGSGERHAARCAAFHNQDQRGALSNAQCVGQADQNRGGAADLHLHGGGMDDVEGGRKRCAIAVGNDQRRATGLGHKRQTQRTGIGIDLAGQQCGQAFHTLTTGRDHAVGLAGQSQVPAVAQSWRAGQGHDGRGHRHLGKRCQRTFETGLEAARGTAYQNDLGALGNGREVAAQAGIDIQHQGGGNLLHGLVHANGVCDDAGDAIERQAHSPDGAHHRLTRQRHQRHIGAALQAALVGIDHQQIGQREAVAQAVVNHHGRAIGDGHIVRRRTGIDGCSHTQGRRGGGFGGTAGAGLNGVADDTGAVVAHQGHAQGLTDHQGLLQGADAHQRLRALGQHTRALHGHGAAQRSRCAGQQHQVVANRRGPVDRLA